MRDELTRANEEQEQIAQQRERQIAEHATRISDLEKEREEQNNEMQTLRDNIATKKVSGGGVDMSVG